MNDFDITDIETTLKGIVRRSGASETVYSNRPKATPSPKDDFVVVSVVGNVDDVAAYGSCKVFIYLFARDSQAFKNGPKLSKMQTALKSGMPGFEGRYEFDRNYSVLGDVPDDYGYHARVIELLVTIKSE